MENLQRTTSSESGGSRTSSVHLSLAATTNPSRKGRTVNSTTDSHATRASISMPPPPPVSRPTGRQGQRSLSRGSEFLISSGIAAASSPTRVQDSPPIGGAEFSADAVDTSFPEDVGLMPVQGPPGRLSRPTTSDTESVKRHSFSSVRSLGLISTNPSGPSSAYGSEPDEGRSEGLAAGSTTATSQISVILSAMATNPTTAAADEFSVDGGSIAASPLSVSPQQQATATQMATVARSQDVIRSAKRSITAKRAAGGLGSGTTSPNREKTEAEARQPPLGIIGICALDSKARSKPSRHILSRINAKQEFEVRIFGDKVILDEEPENWPLCDYLISFFSDGFPLDKAIQYVKLRKPFSVNDLPMQKVLWDRRLCLYILDRLKVPTPKRVEVTRDGGPRLSSPELAQHVFERTGLRLPGPSDGTGGGDPPPKEVFMIDDDTLSVDGVELKKPFVEKPVSGEDHNIHIYYASADGGGGRRLFRKVNNKSSEADPTLLTPRCILHKTESFIYESFLASHGNEDVKAYTVGTGFCHVETRKSPVVDGIVKRNTHGKEVRYVTSLSSEEAQIAARIAEAFGQRVCGFDLLRVQGKSYVIDVNGWSFVKDNVDYYDRCAHILKNMFVLERYRREGAAIPTIADEFTTRDTSSRPSGGHFSSLKSILKSPSMSRLHGKTHDGNPSSITTSQTIPISASPSIENPGSLTLPAPPSSHRESVSAGQSPDICPVKPSKESSSEKGLEESGKVIPPPAANAQWKLKGMVGVIRHADRTPKQKFKFTFHTKPFVNLLNGHREEVFLTGEAALGSVMDAVQIALAEGIEDVDKLKLLRTSLVKKGSWAGTKVQIKPMFRKHKKTENEPAPTLPSDTTGQPPEAPNAEVQHDGEHGEQRIKTERSSSLTTTTLSRASAEENNLQIEKLQLIVKWGGEPTHSARYQAQELGEIMRNDLLLMNRDAVNDLTVYSSSERRVTTSAQIWTAAFLDRQDIPPDDIHIRKDLLDDSNAAKDEMDKVKKKLKGLLRQGIKAPPQFAWPDNMPEPFIVVRNVVELMKFHRRVMRQNYSKLYGTASATLAAAAKGQSTPSAASGGSLSQAQAVNNIQGRWCSGEDAELFKERWEKLFAEFQDPEKVDPGKISELHDTMKFDALHNRPFLEWVFTPSASILAEISQEKPSAKSGTEATTDDTPQSGRPRTGTGVKDSATAEPPVEKQGNFAHRVSTGFRRRSEVDPSTMQKNANEINSESYFSLYTGIGKSKTKTDERLEKLRELFLLSKVLFDFIGPQEYGITDAEKLEIGLLTSLPLLRAIVDDLEDMQASAGAKTSIYFTKESHIYTLLNCIIEGGIQTKIQRNKIPELDYLSTICFELYESRNITRDDESDSFNYSIRITISPGCHTFEPLDVQLDSKHCIGFAARRSLTAHGDWKQITETLRAKFHTVKLPKSFLAINLSEKISPTPENENLDTDPVKSQPLGQGVLLGGEQVDPQPSREPGMPFV